jgi:dTMP kinase
MSGNIFIVLEGIDGSGKSSVSKELALHTDALYYRCPPRILTPLRNTADSSPYYTRYLYYLIGNYIAQREIRKLLTHTGVVCDWYVYSTIAYHSVLLNKQLRIPTILIPDKLFYLYATTEQISKRLNERGSQSKFENLAFLERVKHKYEELLEHCPNVVRIDTTNKPVHITVNELLQKMG